MIRGGNLRADGSTHLVDDGLVFISAEKAIEFRRSTVSSGDLVFTCWGTVNQVGLIGAGSRYARYVISNKQMQLTPNPALADSLFLFYLFSSAAVQNAILGQSIGSTIPGFNLGQLRSLRILLPPLPEQRTIAAALGDVDALRDGLDRLIAKKRALKQAASQELLTGRTRLPGFSGVWEVRALGELFAFSGGYTASREQLSATGHCYLHYGDIHTSTKTVVDVSADYADIPKLDVPLNRVSSGSLLADGDVVFVDASEDDAGTSKHVVVVNKEARPFISGLHTIVAKARTDELVHEYRRHCFQTWAVRKQFLFYAVGTKVSGISKTNLAKVTIPVPRRDEQAAIADVLSDMDAELAALEARREKTRLLKQGMMQELLTGRIRLV